MKTPAPEIATRLRPVLELFWAGGVARLSSLSRGVIEIDGEPVCRLSVIEDLLHAGLIEVAGPQSWRGKTCSHCRGVKPPGFACCDEIYS